MLLYCDLETFNETPISYGSHRYAETAEVLLWGYAIDDKPARVWDLTSQKTMPEDLRCALEAIVDRGEGHTVWHNGLMFDTIVLKHAMGIDIPANRVFDTMLMAYQNSLPGSLAQLSEVFRMSKDVAKDKDGKRLVQLFCKPLPATRKIQRATSQTHPEDWNRFINYCRLDVEAERELFKKLPRFNFTRKEFMYQCLDAKINRRGMLMDVDLAKAAVACAQSTKGELDKRVKDLTNGSLDAATQRDKLIAFIKEEFGWDVPSMTKAEIEKRIQDPSIPEPMRELLALRLMSTRTSVKKFEAVINSVNKDNRLRGCLQFRGAARTGRFSGRLFQPQNLPRPSMEAKEIEEAIQLAKVGVIDMFYEDVNSVLANCLRGEIVAPKGKKLVVADYSNVEGRVLAWLASEQWKINAFRDFDAGHGHDLYKLTYGRTFNVKPDEVTKDQRQMGKVLELAMGYQGGAGAFVTFAKGYGIDLNAMAKTVQATIAPKYWLSAENSFSYFKEKGSTHGLKRNTFIACDAVKRAWRDANNEIASLWSKADSAIVDAMTSPKRFPIGKHCTVERKGTWLLIRLPSGRYLCYPAAKLHDDGTCTFSYMGVNQYTRKWERIKTYGGKVCIAEDTLVVTKDGLKPIQEIQPGEKVWDGVEWVSQEGAICNGTKEVIEAYGVWMTPDHKVLTEKGWKDASQSKGYNRASCGLPRGSELYGFGWAKVAMEGALRLRKRNYPSGHGAHEDEKSRNQSVVRLHEVKNDQREESDSRSIATPNVGGMALNEAAMRMPNTPSMGQLRWPWDQGVRKMVRVVREFLGRHAPKLFQGIVIGSHRQQRELRALELPVDNKQGAKQQQTKYLIHRWEASELLGEENGAKPVNAPVQAATRVPQGTLVRPTRYNTKVYDLVNAGPRKRFVVIGEDGPVIVHNCENITQAVSCDLLLEALTQLERAGYQTVLTVHDEAITEAPDSEEYNEQNMIHIMTQLPHWAEGLPIAAAGYSAYRYKKD